jgi:hypothetical protein
MTSLRAGIRYDPVREGKAFLEGSDRQSNQTQ